MNWREKLSTLRQALADDTLMFVFDVAGAAPEDFIEQVRDIAPYLPESYLEFFVSPTVLRWTTSYCSVPGSHSSQR